MKVTIHTEDSPKGEITIYRLENSHGAAVTLSSLGAGIVGIEVPDANGKLADVVLGYKNPADYLYDGPCAGKTPGRYANRIARGQLTIDGREYQLAVNNGPNHLHGGPEGFQNQIWDCEMHGSEYVVFTLQSPDGDENYPGNLTARVQYGWNDDNQLYIALSAVTDAATVVNLTNHTYFNLSGESSGSVLDHMLYLNADTYLPTDDTLIPTGEMAPVAGTPMDFTEFKKIGAEIKADFPALRYGKGYDNCWVLNPSEQNSMLKQAATLADPKSRRTLTVFTSQPAVQVYTGNWLNGSPIGKSGRSYNDYDGVAIECQGMPDAPNHTNFPSQELQPDGEYMHYIVFAFSTINDEE